MCVGPLSLPCEFIIPGFVSVKWLENKATLKICFFPDCSGKLFGTEADYLVAEAEFQEGAGEEEEEAEGEGGGEEYERKKVLSPVHVHLQEEKVW